MNTPLHAIVNKYIYRAFIIQLRIAKTESCVYQLACNCTLGKYIQNSNLFLKSLQIQTPCERKTY